MQAPKPRWQSNVPDDAVARGDGEFIARFADAFGTITKDSVAGRAGEKMVLRDWQRQLLADVFPSHDPYVAPYRAACLSL